MPPFHLDLLPDHTRERVLVEVRHPARLALPSSSTSSRLGSMGIKAGACCTEHLGKDGMHDPVALAHAIKALPITVAATRPIDEAISTAGRAFEALRWASHGPGLTRVCFVRARCWHWEAPTGGYLLTACLASGVRAGQGV